MSGANTAHAVSNQNGSNSLAHIVTAGAVGVIQSELPQVPLYAWPLLALLLAAISVLRLHTATREKPTP